MVHTNISITRHSDRDLRKQLKLAREEVRYLENEIFSLQAELENVINSVKEYGFVDFFKDGNKLMTLVERKEENAK